MKKLFTLLFIVASLGFCFGQAAFAAEMASFPFSVTEDFEKGELSPIWNRFFISPPADLKKAKVDSEDLYRVALRSPNLAIVNDPVRHGQGALKITVFPKDAQAKGDEEKGKSRAEIGIQNVSREGAEGWYSWSVYIPTDYIDAPKGKKPFQTLTQFHRYTREVNGQYRDFSELSKSERKKSTGVSAAVSVRYANVTGRQPTLTLEYGVGKGRLLFERPITKGQWNDWLLHIRWSRANDGYIEAWLNGEPLTPKSGADHRVYRANLYTSLPVEARWGIYRGHHKYKTVNSIVIDNIRISPDPPNRADVL